MMVMTDDNLTIYFLTIFILPQMCSHARGIPDVDIIRNPADTSQIAAEHSDTENYLTKELTKNTILDEIRQPGDDSARGQRSSMRGEVADGMTRALSGEKHNNRALSEVEAPSDVISNSIASRDGGNKIPVLSEDKENSGQLREQNTAARNSRRRFRNINETNWSLTDTQRHRVQTKNAMRNNHGSAQIENRHMPRDIAGRGRALNDFLNQIFVGAAALAAQADPTAQEVTLPEVADKGAVGEEPDVIAVRESDDDDERITTHRSLTAIFTASGNLPSGRVSFFQTNASTFVQLYVKLSSTESNDVTDASPAGYVLEVKRFPPEATCGRSGNTLYRHEMSENAPVEYMTNISSQELSLFGNGSIIGRALLLRTAANTQSVMCAEIVPLRGYHLTSTTNTSASSNNDATNNTSGTNGDARWYKPWELYKTPADRKILVASFTAASYPSLKGTVTMKQTDGLLADVTTIFVNMTSYVRSSYHAWQWYIANASLSLTSSAENCSDLTAVYGNNGNVTERHGQLKFVAPVGGIGQQQANTGTSKAYFVDNQIDLGGEKSVRGKALVIVALLNATYRICANLVDTDTSAVATTASSTPQDQSQAETESESRLYKGSGGRFGALYPQNANQAGAGDQRNAWANGVASASLAPGTNRGRAKTGTNAITQYRSRGPILAAGPGSLRKREGADADKPAKKQNNN